MIAKESWPQAMQIIIRQQGLLKGIKSGLLIEGLAQHGAVPSVGEALGNAIAENYALAGELSKLMDEPNA